MIANSIMSLGGRFAQMLIGFVLPPFVVAQLGNEQYGLVAVVLNLTWLIHMVQMGTPQSLTRFISADLARNDNEEASRVLSTGLAILVAAGIVAGILSAVIYAWPGLVFDLPDDVPLSTIRTLFAIGAAAVVFGIPLSIGEVSFSVKERFGPLNLLKVSGNILRMGLVFLLLSLFGGNVIAYAIAIKGTFLIEGIVVLAVGIFLLKEARLSWHYVSGATAKRITVFGVEVSLRGLSWLMFFSFNMVLVGRMLGNEAVTQYELAFRWVNSVRALMMTAMAVALPAAAKRNAVGDTQALHQMVVRMTKYGLLFTLLPYIFLFLFRQRVMLTWMGPGYEEAAALMMLLVIADLLNTTFSALGPISSATGAVRFITVVNFILGPVNLLMAALFMGPMNMGLIGVGLSLVIAFALRACTLLIYVHRYLHMDPMTYLRRSYLGPLLAGVCAAPAAMAVHYVTPEKGWGGLIAAACVLSVLYLPIVYGVAFDKYDRKIFMGMAWGLKNRVLPLKKKSSNREEMFSNARED